MLLLRTTAATLALGLTGLAGTASADIQHLDDVIIGFSLCVGNDCVNGESFGFDTVRLKENNVRLHFDDTSTSSSFPNNDWRLTANDSSNGGGNYFAIEDATRGQTPFRVEAGAGSHALYVDDGGRIGVGTSTPVSDIHTKTGNTPTLRLEQDGSSGFTAQTWDLAGNEAGFFVRDASNGSTLPFRIRPGAPSSAIDIAADGDVGIGTTSPSAPLHIRRTNSTASLMIEDTGTGFNPMVELVQGNTPRIRFDNSTADNAPTGGGTNLTAEWDIGLASDHKFLFRSIQENANVVTIDHAGDMTITGALTTGGGTCGGGCDRVFDAEYELPTISDHAAVMWENGYLPNVGPTKENTPINVSDKLGRMLNELEHAHIYIAELHERLETLESKLTK